MQIKWLEIKEIGKGIGNASCTEYLLGDRIAAARGLSG